MVRKKGKFNFIRRFALTFTLFKCFQFKLEWTLKLLIVLRGKFDLLPN